MRPSNEGGDIVTIYIISIHGIEHHRTVSGTDADNWRRIGAEVETVVWGAKR